jgi:hypothetical protein
MKSGFTVLCFFLYGAAFAQLEVSTGVAINKQDALGPALQIGYDFRLNNKLHTKTQLGYKYLRHYNDYVDGTLKVQSLEIHQTVSFEFITRKTYVLRPNIGINYRFYRWKGEMNPPYDAMPQRAWVIGVRDKNLVLTSFDGGYATSYRVHNLGFSLQLQNQFRLNDKIWLHITPFIEPDYDRVQNIGGCYAGIIFKGL